MKQKESLELKIVKILLPLLIYYGILLLTQCGFGIYALMHNFRRISEGDAGVNYKIAWYFFTETENYLQTHGLLVNAVACILTIPVLYRLWKKQDFMGEGKKRLFWLRGKAVLYVSAAGIFASASLSKLVTMIQAEALTWGYEKVNQSFISNPMVFQILTLCILSPVAEELIFRGMMYGRLKDYLDGREKAVLVQALIFGVYHGNVIQGVYAAVLSVVLVFVYEKYQSILAPVLLHIVANTMALLMMYAPVSNQISSNLLAKVCVMILELAVFAFLLFQIAKEERKTGEET